MRIAIATGSVAASTPAPACRTNNATVSAREAPNARTKLSGDSAYKRFHFGIVGLTPPVAVIEQIAVGQLQQALQHDAFAAAKPRQLAGEKRLEQQIELEQTAAAAPAQPLAIAIADQVTRLTSNWRMCPIALVGFSSFGHTSTQFIIV